ncbi:MAG: magnesium chelatase domain-containing protein [Elusimicrobiota bacterium]
MLSVVSSAALLGIDGVQVDVEVDFRAGLPAFSIVGLPDAGVKESKERVIAALKNSNYFFPLQRITVNLAPGHIRKEGTTFDLAIAIGILSTTGLISAESTENTAFLGELGLNGDLRPIRGVLPCVSGLFKKGIKRVFVAKPNADEAALVENLEVYGAKNLIEVVSHLMGENHIPVHTINHQHIFSASYSNDVDFSEVKGQLLAKRALEIAAAGGHNLLCLCVKGVV